MRFEQGGQISFLEKKSPKNGPGGVAQWASHLPQELEDPG
jgi:hypothetical protein